MIRRIPWWEAFPSMMLCITLNDAMHSLQLTLSIPCNDDKENEMTLCISCNDALHSLQCFDTSPSIIRCVLFNGPMQSLQCFDTFPSMVRCLPFPSYHLSKLHGYGIPGSFLALLGNRGNEIRNLHSLRADGFPARGWIPHAWMDSRRVGGFRRG